MPAEPVCERCCCHERLHRPWTCGKTAPTHRGPGPRRARRRMRELLPDAAGPSAPPAAAWRRCNFAGGGNPVCKTCTPRAASLCARCGQDRPAAARWPEGPVCDTCYTSALRRRGACTACGQQRRLIALPGPGVIMRGLRLACRSPTYARYAASRTNCSRKAAAPAAACATEPRTCWPALEPSDPRADRGRRGHHGGPEPLLVPELAADQRIRDNLAEIAAGRTAPTHQALDARPGRGPPASSYGAVRCSAPSAKPRTGGSSRPT